MADGQIGMELSVYVCNRGAKGRGRTEKKLPLQFALHDLDEFDGGVRVLIADRPRITQCSISEMFPFGRNHFHVGNGFYIRKRHNLRKADWVTV